MISRCWFITSSYSSTRLRIRKFCSSTFFWAPSICLESILASIGSSSPSSPVGAEAVEDPVDPVAGEQAHQVVLGREVEARLAGIALAAGAAAQLVVDPARLVALGAEDVQAAGLHHLLAVALDLRPRSRAASRPTPCRTRACRARCPALAQRQLGEVLGVAAELDVHAAAGHVGGDRDRAGAARLGDGLALALGVLGLGVEHRVLDALLVQLPGQQLGDLDRDRAHEHRLALLVALARSR